MKLVTQSLYFKNRDPKIFGPDSEQNSKTLIASVNILLSDYKEWLEEENSVMVPPEITVTSGGRTKAENKAIYAAINAKRVRDGLQPIPEATDSSHLIGMGIDIYDQWHLFQQYILTERAKALFEPLGIYFEHFSATPNWVHCTTRAPKSGKRFFYP